MGRAFPLSVAARYRPASSSRPRRAAIRCRRGMISPFYQRHRHRAHLSRYISALSTLFRFIRYSRHRRPRRGIMPRRVGRPASPFRQPAHAAAAGFPGRVILGLMRSTFIFDFRQLIIIGDYCELKEIDFAKFPRFGLCPRQFRRFSLPRLDTRSAMPANIRPRRRTTPHASAYLRLCRTLCRLMSGAALRCARRSRMMIRPAARFRRVIAGLSGSRESDYSRLPGLSVPEAAR